MQIEKKNYWVVEAKKELNFSHRRDHIEILAKMVYLCTRPKTKTALMKENNLSYSLLKKSVDQLIEQELIETQGLSKGNKLITTQKGKTFLKKYFELQKYLKKDAALTGKSLELRKCSHNQYFLSN